MTKPLQMREININFMVNRRQPMNKTKPGFKNFYLNILFVLFIGGIGVQSFTSCSSDDVDDPPPPPGTSSALGSGDSSSSSDDDDGSSSSDDDDYGSSSSVGGGSGLYCDFGPVTEYGGGCFEIDNASDCDTEWGQVVNVCDGNSSSSVGGSSSSSIGGNSSSSSIGNSSSSSNFVVGNHFSPNIQYSSFTDSRNGKTYKSVVIGTQIWMAENLDYDPGTGYSTSTPYGRLYYWTTAMDLGDTYIDSQWGGSDVKRQGICPAGWYLPSQTDRDKLYLEVSDAPLDNSGSPTAGRYLKAKSGWSNNANGEDTYGFSALPGGYALAHSNSDGSLGFTLFNVGTVGRWWTSTEATGTSAKYISANTSDRADGGIIAALKANLHSVRCMKENNTGTSSSSATQSSSSKQSKLYCDFGPVNEDGGGCFEITSASECDTQWGRVVSVCTPTITTFVDSRDQKTYKKVKIGTQTWMAENLNYNASDSKCYNDDLSSCNTYGRLYNWTRARTVCPSGWHLPSQDEWDEMTDYIGGQETEGRELKATSGWIEDGNGMDEYGFNALPGGYGYSNNGDYAGRGFRGHWWTSTEDYRAGYNGAYYRYMSYEYDYAVWYPNEKLYYMSVRCVQ